MLFAYVYTADDCEPMVVDDDQHAALLLDGCDALAILMADILGADVAPGAITSIEVETGEDADERGYPDKDSPYTVVVYERRAE